MIPQGESATDPKGNHGMKFANAAAAAVLLCMSFAGRAETFTTPVLSFDAPDNLVVLDRDDSAQGGKPATFLVLGVKGDVPRAVFIITCSQTKADAPKSDLGDVAVKMGNPFDPKLTAADADDVVIGGLPGKRYDGILPNGLRAVSYVAERDGYLLIVVLKGPTSKPYGRAIDQMSAAIEQLRWTLPVADAAKPAAEPSSGALAPPTEAATTTGV